MATKTLGTNANNTLPYAITWQPGGISAADLATIRNHILNDLISATAPASAAIWAGALESGALYIPNRGKLLLVPGDIIGVGTEGWPILLSAAEASADWTLT